MWKRILFLVLIAGASVITPEEPAAASAVRMDGYVIETPSGKGWRINKNKDYQTVELLKKLEPAQGDEVVMIVVVPQNIVGMYGGVHTKRWLGDDVRRREESNMIAMGVMTGMYRLQNVRKFDVRIGDKQGHAMRYDQVFPFQQAHGYLFVFFPPNFEKTGIFYKFVCSVTGMEVKLQDIDLSDFYSVISSFRIRKN